MVKLPPSFRKPGMQLLRLNLLCQRLNFDRVKRSMTRRRIAILLTLIFVTVAAFWGTYRSNFIKLDDEGYVTQNHMVQAGMTWRGFEWAFTSGHMSNWHPLTWISHMADCQFFGLQPSGHHL